MMTKEDMNEHEHKDVIENEKTVFDYLNVLERLFIINNQEAYTENYRSKDRTGKSAKKHFAKIIELPKSKH